MLDVEACEAVIPLELSTAAPGAISVDPRTASEFSESPRSRVTVGGATAIAVDETCGEALMDCGIPGGAIAGPVSVNWACCTHWGGAGAASALVETIDTLDETAPRWLGPAGACAPRANGVAYRSARR